MTRALLGAIALLALAHTAAAGVELGAPKQVERALAPGADVAFEMPLQFTAAGLAYAKILPTEGNAVNDGTRANGTLAPPAGWRVSFALVREDGAREELGTFVDSTPSALAAVAAEERATLVATAHVAADAPPDREHRIYVAIAHRAEGGGTGQASGAAMDDARGITLILSGVAPATAPTTTPAAEAEHAAPPVAPIDESSDDPRPTPTRDATPGWLGGPAMAVALAMGVAALVRCRR